MTVYAKKAFLLISLIITSSFSGCINIQRLNNTIDVESARITLIKDAEQKFKDNNIDGLYNLYSIESRNDCFLRQRIELLTYYWRMMDLDDSHTKSFGSAGEQDNDNNGLVIYYDDSTTITDYYDKDGNCYSLIFSLIAVDQKKPEEEGLYNIRINYCNSTVYKTSIDKRDITDDASKIEKLLEREKAVLKRIEDAKADNAYILADNEGRVVFMRQLLDDIINEEMEQYGNSVINKNSIEDQTTSDSYELFPALRFKFVDGGAFLILVHNHPKR